MPKTFIPMSTNAKIKTLPANVIAKIAAGEVIERAASAIKEIIENSLDAKAQNIKIEIEDFGLQKIQITDDGIGMTEEDLFECYKPHTTSKLFYEDDLVSIATLGFRGEALSSIATISELIIKSRAKDSISGNIIEIKEGSLLRSNAIGMPSGTSVIIRDLFENFPARKKFLKSSQTELRKIFEVIVSAALANPSVGFFFSSDKKIKLDLPPSQSLTERIRMLLGIKFSSNLIPIEYISPHIKIFGFLGKPQISHINKNRQFLFVNGRPIKNDLVSAAVKEAYGTMMMTKDQPVFVLFLEFPPAMLDVNVHPRKEEIAFADALDIFNLLTSSIKPTFAQEDFGYVTSDLPTDEIEYELTDIPSLLLADSAGDSMEYLSNPIYQLHNLYLITETKDGVLLVDQHAAHERILYEKFLDIFEKQIGKIHLEQDVFFELTLSEASALQEYMEVFNKLGYEIELFGANTFKVVTIPYFINIENLDRTLKEILSDLMSGKAPKNVDEKTDRAISYVSCKSAIKSGDYLTETQRLDLLVELSKTKTSYTCPHGRPVKIELSLNEFAKLFRRK